MASVEHRGVGSRLAADRQRIEDVPSSAQWTHPPGPIGRRGVTARMFSTGREGACSSTARV